MGRNDSSHMTISGPLKLRTILLCWVASLGVASSQIYWNNDGTGTIATWDLINTTPWTPGIVPTTSDVVHFGPNNPSFDWVVRDVDVATSVYADSLELYNNFLGGTYSFFNAAGDIGLTNIGGVGMKVGGVGTYYFDGPRIDGGIAGAKIGSIEIQTSAELWLMGNSSIFSTALSNGGVDLLNLRGGTITLDNSATFMSRLWPDTRILFGSGTFSYLGHGSVATSYNYGEIASMRGVNTISVTANGMFAGAVFNNPGAFSLRPTTFASLHFIGNGGVLGGTGPSDPNINFAGTPHFGPLNLLSTVAGGHDGVGFATVTDANGTTYAAYRPGFGIVAANPSLVATTAATLLASTASDFTQYNSPGTVVAPGSFQALVWRITPNGPSQWVNFLSNPMKTNAIMLDGDHDFTIFNAAAAVTNVTGNADDPVFFYVNSPKTILSTDMIIGTQNGPTNIVGPGFVELIGSKQVQLTNTTPQFHRLNLLGGVLRGGQNQIGLTTSDTGTIAFRGGILEITNGTNGVGPGADFTRKLSVTGGMGTVNWSSNLPGDREGGSGGFSAIGSDASVNIDGGVVPTTLTWAVSGSGFVQEGYALTFGSIYSDATLTWWNPIDLGFGTAAGAYAAREIRVTLGQGNAADKTVMAGTISGPVSTDLIKTGNGVLEFATKNSYQGNTIIQEGTLRVAAPGGGSLGATKQIIITGNGTLEYGADNQAHAGAGVTMVGGSMFNLNGYNEGTTASNGLGALTLSGNSTLDMGTAVGATSIIHFDDSSGQPWTGTLSIWNWTGTAVTGGGIDQVLFGFNTAGLTAAQLSQISFYSDAGVTFLGTANWATSLNGEIVPVPEPAAVAAALLLGGAVLWRERKRVWNFAALFRRHSQNV